MKRFCVTSTTLLALTLCISTGCVYQEAIPVIIPPDSTVHFSKLYGEDGGSKSEAKLDSLKAEVIYSKRVWIPTESSDLGRGPGNYEYKISLRPVMTSRSPVYRSWTHREDKGTSTKNQAFHFESRDSINFSAGGVIIARVEHEDAEVYRHTYSGAPLERIIDKDIRTFLQGYMANSYGKLDFRVDQDMSEGTEVIPDCLNRTIQIFQDALAAARVRFTTGGGTDEIKPVGITIDYFGNIGGLSPEKAEVQDRLDRRYIRSMNIHVQEEKNKEQKVRNRMTVALKEAERQAAEYRYETGEAAKLLVLFEAIKLEQEAINNAAMAWGNVTIDPDNPKEYLGGQQGSLPASIMPADASPLAWLLGDSPDQVIAALPTELDPELVEWAETRLDELEQERVEKEALEESSDNPPETSEVTEPESPEPPAVNEPTTETPVDGTE